MAYVVTGTAGSDVLNQSGDTGPGTIVGLAGDDCIFTGSGLATVTGDSGNDTVLLKAGNTGAVNSGTENDSIGDGGTAIGVMQLFGGDGADTIWAPNATGALTIVGGNDSNDGADSISGGTGGDLLFGNGGNDILSDLAGGSDTHVAGFGNDTVFDGVGSNLIFGNQGNDFLNTVGVETIYGGLGNDIFVADSATDSVLFGNEGADRIDTIGDGVTVVGGNDSADGNDTISAGGDGIIAFGNGGADIINIGNGAITGIGGQGSDCIFGATGTFLVFGNEGNDTLAFGPAGALTMFGGQGNDLLIGHAGRDTLQGNEGNDSIRGDGGGSVSIDTIAGGAGNDVFRYLTSSDDGNNAAGGGPVEFITDLNWAEDRFDTPTQVTFAANTGAGTGANLSASANNAVAAAYALAGGGAAVVAAQFTFAGHTYLAVDNQNGVGLTGQFDDANDLLVDITGATGTIAAGNFISPPAPSDVRLKRDIVRLGSLDGGISLYRYRYAWSDQLYVGVMAHEVATVAPGAVAPGPDGYLRVDYARLGLRLQTWEQWATASQRPG